VTDVGSVKQAAIRDVAPHIPQGVHFVPGHPIAGTEHSGPEAGFAALFAGRWAILTPLPATAPPQSPRSNDLWEAIGSKVEIMEPAHHDRVLAITSHLPHLIAYTIVGTAADLETDTQSEVIKFSAGGFRDFTRIAAVRSDHVARYFPQQPGSRAGNRPAPDRRPDRPAKSHPAR
jgi:cyclohexadieny/prephenate dehydrogenase